MSISATLSNALTGLTASSRAAQLVSNNVSNAATEGYARRELQLSPRIAGGDGAGVQVDGVVRIVDETLVRERRLAAATAGSAKEAEAFLRSTFDLLGQPESAGSLAARVAGLEGSVLEAISRPDSEARLAAVLTSAKSLTDKLNDVSDGIRSLREDADRDIGVSVERLNQTLGQIAELNTQILRSRRTEQDYPSLLDRRQHLIDSISDLVPIRQLQRENGTVVLYTMNGALLLDSRPSVFGFTATAPITPDMTLASGALSGLTINGTPVVTAGDHGQIAGGRIAALFNVRDVLAVTAQDDIDEVARDLVARFEDPSLDATLAVGDPGLFTDRGAVLDVTNIVGLAGRIEVNALVDPSQGGALWRLRDGIGAVVPGPVGDTALLTAISDRLLEARIPSGGNFSGAALSVAGFASASTSFFGQSLQGAANTLGFEEARLVGLEQAILAQGVDTDQEMQKLLLIEQAYAANARVIQTADELIQILIGL